MEKDITTILVVDDDSAVRESFEKNMGLEEAGYRLIGTAEDGISGLELIEAHNPSIVITDIKMPCMDGLAMIEEIKKREYHPRIIILSGYEDFEYARKAVNLSVDAYLEKPIEMYNLINILNLTKEKAEREKSFLVRFEESIPLLRQIFLSQLFYGYYKDIDFIRDKINLLRLSIKEGPFLCAAVNIQRLDNGSKSSRFGIELYKDIIINIFTDTLKDICYITSVQNRKSK
jgi:two-component system response regulator YesN